MSWKLWWFVEQNVLGAVSERLTERVCNEERAGSQDQTDAGWLCGSDRIYILRRYQPVETLQYTQMCEKNFSPFSQKTHFVSFIYIKWVFWFIII
jgi:hypothetical protein